MQNRLMTRREQLVLMFLGTAVVAGAGVVVWRNVQAQPSEVESAVHQEDVQRAPAEPEPAAVAVEEPVEAAPLVVSIQGAVRQPGVYELPPGARVNDLLEEAHGATQDARLRYINRAAPLVDGTTLTIPAQHEETGTVPNPPEYLLAGPTGVSPATVSGSGGQLSRSPAVQSPQTAGKIDLNHASSAELQELPGVGPVYAQAIIEYRQAHPFQRIEELQNVRGIGPKRFEAMRDLIVVNP